MYTQGEQHDPLDDDELLPAEERRRPEPRVRRHREALAVRGAADRQDAGGLPGVVGSQEPLRAQLLLRAAQLRTHAVRFGVSFFKHFFSCCVEVSILIFESLVLWVFFGVLGFFTHIFDATKLSSRKFLAVKRHKDTV